jgi:hypothetical protein
MRPAGEIRTALLEAASEMYRFENAELRGPTLAELAEKACVGRGAARQCVSNMKRAGELAIVKERVVNYRNRPVAEYAPADAVQAKRANVFADLNQCMADWVR